jgi:hypothetical protein
VPDRRPAQPVEGPPEKPLLDKLGVKPGMRMSLEPYIRRSGGIWLLTRKGSNEANQNDAMRAGLAVGLVDNKNAAFSDEWSALRFVIPVARR